MSSFWGSLYHTTDDPDGWRYNSDDFLGTEKDFFNSDFNNVFTKYSNPAAYLGDDATATNVGFQIVGFNSQSKSYTLSIQVNSSGVLSLAPAKPQNLKIVKGNYNPSLHKYLIRLNWYANTEPDLSLYEIWRKVEGGISGGTWGKIGTSTTNSYDDYDFFWGGSINLYYKIRAKDTQGKYSIYSDEATGGGSYAPKIKGESVEVVQNKSEYFLSYNYPNPFNPSTDIMYTLKESGLVVLRVYDVLGREVAVIKNEYEPAGSHTAHFDASNLESGVYFYTLSSRDYYQVKKMILLR